MRTYENVGVVVLCVCTTTTQQQFLHFGGLLTQVSGVLYYYMQSQRRFLLAVRPIRRTDCCYLLTVWQRCWPFMFHSVCGQRFVSNVTLCKIEHVHLALLIRTVNVASVVFRLL